MELLNQPVDISGDFYKTGNEYYVAGPVTGFNPEKGTGTTRWQYHRWVHDWSFIKIGMHLEQQEQNKTFWHDYEVHPECAFSLSFINARTIRLRMKTTRTEQMEYPSLMLDGEPATGMVWPVHDTHEKAVYKSEYGSVTIHKKNWRLDICDASDRLLTGTQGMEILDALHHKTIPFLFTRRSSDYSRSIAASFMLSNGEKIVGGGESFTALNKRGQKLVMWSTDTQSAGTSQQYKPVPFIMSNRGYGLFFHTTSPVTMDIGQRYDSSNTVYIGDDQLDVFIFIGSPKEILTEYTALTGRAPLPPLWTFGLWMSRFTYRSDKEVREVADSLRQHSIPCDVIHIDSGWFKNGYNCDFSFNPETFPDPKGLIQYLREKGFRTSLWQIPYFTPQNPVYREVVEKKIFVKDGNGNVPAEDAVLDFSNPGAVAWYTHKIKTLLDLGVDVIKADFGEAAPLRAVYASGRSGFYEHNAYPLRYTQLLYNLSKQVTGQPVIWARSAWAGGQRYPVHWGGDPEVSDMGMAASLRGGLSLGLGGFTFWSHDIGGFSSAPVEELFTRWALFGMLTSHSRVHGFPPREPWHFSATFVTLFRKITELRYRLLPYIYTQAYIASKEGWPLMRALLLDYPADPVAWMIDDQYMFGEYIMVAPLLEAGVNKRTLYLPAGKWFNYQSKEIYEGEKWYEIEAGELPGILLVKCGCIIPQILPGQSTSTMDWSNIELIVFSTHKKEIMGKYYCPKSNSLINLRLSYPYGDQPFPKTYKDCHITFSIKSFD